MNTMPDIYDEIMDHPFWPQLKDEWVPRAVYEPVNNTRGMRFKGFRHKVFHCMVLIDEEGPECLRMCTVCRTPVEDPDSGPGHETFDNPMSLSARNAVILMKEISHPLEDDAA